MEKLERLDELTRQESGIVIYGNEVIICNWLPISGYPRLDPLGIKLMGLGEELEEIKGEKISGEAVKEMMEGKEILYDVNNDIAEIMAGDCEGTIYELSGATVIAPDGWH